MRQRYLLIYSFCSSEKGSYGFVNHIKNHLYLQPIKKTVLTGKAGIEVVRHLNNMGISGFSQLILESFPLKNKKNSDFLVFQIICGRV